jgi:hypothetical protein
MKYKITGWELLDEDGLLDITIKSKDGCMYSGVIDFICQEMKEEE